MSGTTQEIASGAVREIEPELRDLFIKVVERDPRDAVQMLEPYPDEFVVQMLELLNPASAMDAQPNVPGAYYRTLDAAAIGRFSSANDCRRSNRTNSTSGQQSHYHLRFCHRRAGETSWRYRDARPVAGAKQSAPGGDHARESVLSHAGNVSARCDESGVGSALPG